tara:strand:+ start:112 stop:375 length:264 start_codon:yes stop_codon:yes gene_type:complete
MATFTSPEVIVNRSAEDFFNKIGDLNNLKEIMPSSIKDFESTATTCSFKMKGMPALNLELGEKTSLFKNFINSKRKSSTFFFGLFYY